MAGGSTTVTAHISSRANHRGDDEPASTMDERYGPRGFAHRVLGYREPMDRGNTKHGRILDEQMEQETRNIPHNTEADDTDDDSDELSRLGRYIPRTSLPGNRDDLLVGASQLHAPDDVIEQLKRLPAQDTFATVAEVWETLRS